jgi:hypothetical protein
LLDFFSNLSSDNCTCSHCYTLSGKQNTYF